MAEKKEETVAFKRVEITTQTAPAIQDVKGDKILTIDEAIVEILNRLDRIERAIV